MLQCIGFASWRERERGREREREREREEKRGDEGESQACCGAPTR